MSDLAEGTDPKPARRWPLVAALVMGIGLALAPVAFQMFSRAPAGGGMIDDFRPYMRTQKIDDFRSELSRIDAAEKEAAGALATLGPEAASRYPSVATFVHEWPGIDADMRSMLTTMEHNIGNYEGVAALPPFALFPWFFVIPGVLIAGVAGWSLRADRGRAQARGRKVALYALAVGLIAAPAVFQMFTRAPGGAEMIDGFKPFMTPAKVTKVQGYFLTIGAGEGQLRRAIIPDLAAASGTPPDDVLPAVHALNRDWPTISGDMAPMVGTMADNVGAFSGIAALPPFGLFPWFFVLPGVLLLLFTWRLSTGTVAGAPAAAPAGASRWQRRTVLRGLAGAIVVAELVTLTGMNIALDRRAHTTTTTRRTVAAPAARPAVPPTSTPAAPTRAAAAPKARPVEPPAAVPAVPVATEVASPPSTQPVEPTGPGTPALSCPLPLPPAPSGGGVASLTPLLPAFGPYSAEAFAMMPAFSPLFPLFGPLLVEGQKQLEANSAGLAVLIPLLQEVEGAGFDALFPLYHPYRQQVLGGEKTMAEQLAQVTGALAGTPGAGCIPAIEALLTGGSSS